MRVVYAAPEVEAYLSLRKAAGLEAKGRAAAAAALQRTLFSVQVLDDEMELKGMGRIIGDGGCHYQLVDVAVHPEYRPEETKERIVDELLGYLDRYAPEDADVMVMADLSQLPLYQKAGFKLVYPDYYGMTRRPQTERAKEAAE